ncbi:magnesium transporter [Pelagicoccus sp. NFK12]|uniref:Magnesium transporter MgtE n=1 Tax=Pelagicoccus enzymogenes TaxID=2773457 RepID=A0A927IH30_9BACT|nr:magnesium transporter [Pelagicoccus enzymogenes]MBD5781827.1 magnesium transporter [Pelagicoccus enzymogenes]MDQ8196583.1 magnesium transporter [Pelagicoccus enzymogenes]
MEERDEQTQPVSSAFDRDISRLKEMHPSDIAEAIEDRELSEIRSVLREFSDEYVAEILTELPQEIQTDLMENMRLDRVSEIIPEMYSDDAADALGQVSPERLKSIMDQLPDADVEEITTLLEYPEDTAGGIMRKEVHTVLTSMALSEAREAIRRGEEEDQDNALYVYAVDENGRLQGVLRLRDLLFRDLRLKVSSVMITDVRSISVNADQEEIANIFQKYNYLALPVVDDFGKLVGLVTSDDVIDVIQEEATEDMQRMVGLSGEEMVTTHWSRSAKNRIPWLLVNLGTAFLAAWVVSMFEDTLVKYAMLAAFLPIVGGMGGNAGAQTLTIVVRSLALGEIEDNEWRRVLIKEILIGSVSGVVIGATVGLISWLWMGSWVLGGVVCLAMQLNLLAAALAGVMVPIGLRAVKVDPALASSIMVTTVTDVMGFFLFLSLASIALKFLAL